MRSPTKKFKVLFHTFQSENNAVARQEYGRLGNSDVEPKNIKCVTFHYEKIFPCLRTKVLLEKNTVHTRITVSKDETLGETELLALKGTLVTFRLKRMRTSFKIIFKLLSSAQSFKYNGRVAQLEYFAKRR